MIGRIWKWGLGSRLSCWGMGWSGRGVRIGVVGRAKDLLRFWDREV